MLPDIEEVEVSEELETSNTAKIYFDDGVAVGTTDGLDAIKQAIYIILGTEKAAYLIHSLDFGIEISDLIGKDIEYCASELKDRIIEALEIDNRIVDVRDFAFEKDGKKLIAYFTVDTNLGTFDYSQEFDI